MSQTDTSAEDAAKIIYERAMRYLRLDVPEWVDGGNSLAQDEARAIAACILTPVLAERDALREQLATARNDALEEAAKVADEAHKYHSDARGVQLTLGNDDAAQDRMARMTTCRCLGHDIRALKQTQEADSANLSDRRGCPGFPNGAGRVRVQCHPNRNHDGDAMSIAKIEQTLLGLIDLTGFTSLTIGFNDEHAANYTNAKGWHDEWGMYDDLRKWISEEDRAKAFEQNTVWSAQWYPDTPVGFYILYASSLEILIERLAQCQKG